MGSSFDPPRTPSTSLAKLFAGFPPAQPGGLLGLGGFALGLAAPSGGSASLLTTLGFPTGARSRTEWNSRFGHWQRPATPTEEGTIDRAERNVREALGNSDWLVGQKVSLWQQGSYLNNTNVRNDADIDLRLVHPLMKVDYAVDVYQSYADAVLTLSDSGVSFAQLFANLRSESIYHLSQRFGVELVDANGNKAIAVNGITGSRAEVDVVPTLVYRHVSWNAAWSQYQTVEGVAILGKDGAWTINYPQQHHDNGKAKRSGTACRFKKNVRIFKRLRSDLPNAAGGQVASFLVECLVYLVENEHFLVESDDLYARVRRIVLRMRELLGNPLISMGLREINDIKPLFGAGQAWSQPDAIKFVDAVVAHLGAA